MVKYDRNTLFQVSASWDVFHPLFLHVKLPITIVVFSHVMSSKTNKNLTGTISHTKSRSSGANWQRQNSVDWKYFLRSKLEYISWTLGCIAPDFGFTRSSLTGKIGCQSRAVWKAIMAGPSKRYDLGSWLDSLKGMIWDHGWTVWKVWFGIMAWQSERQDTNNGTVWNWKVWFGIIAGQSQRYDLGSWLDSLKSKILTTGQSKRCDLGLWPKSLKGRFWIMATVFEK